MPILFAPELTRFAHDIMRGAGLPEPKAAIVAESLVAANLRGVDSHGIQLITYYVDQLLAGEMDPLTDGRVISESGATMAYDGLNGVGQWIAEIATGHAIRLARAHGLGMVTVRESNHYGAAAWWARKVSAAGCIGITVCNASPLVPPWQGKEVRVGTNPICMSVPGPWLLDMATSTVAAGKIFKAYINKQESIPAGWAFDKEGVPTTETDAAYYGMLMPLGGYKGSGLAMMVEILSAVLSGGAMSTELGGIRFRGKLVRVNQMFLAIEISRFMPLEEFRARMEKLVGLIKSTPAAPAYDEVLVAGDPEWRMEAERLASGIPISDANWDTLTKAAARVDVPAPPVE